MASRYSQFGVLDYCYHPVELIQDNGERIHVPCQKCNGCLLHKANVWSSRVSLEIDHNPFSIFFTLTYSNKYLPTLKRVCCPDKLFFEYNSFRNLDLFSEDHLNLCESSVIHNYVYVSNHEDNIRFDGTEDTLRKDDIVLMNFGEFRIPITNSDCDYPNYFSKRDFQLWLKKLRKDIQLNLCPNDTSEFFRYYAVSEIGPTTHRSHLHGILFPKNREIAEYLLSVAMYKNWQMCDKVRFYEYATYCDRSTSSYVSNYVTSINSLPPIYQGTPIQPFRLSSKSPAIGYIAFDKAKIFEDVSRGVFEYAQPVSKPEQSPLHGYPSGYMSRLFPKCYQFASLPYSRLLFIYGYLYREIRGYKRPYLLLSSRLSKELHSSDWEASKACLTACDILGCTPFHYLYLLDLYYSKRALSALGKWYRWQEQRFNEPFTILCSYSNLKDYVSDKIAHKVVLDYFLESFGLCYEDLDFSLIYAMQKKNDIQESYQRDVDNIVSNLQKLPKFNELTNRI